MDHARQLSDEDLEGVLRERGVQRDAELVVEPGTDPQWPWLASLKKQGETLIWGGGADRRAALEELYRSLAQADEIGLP